MGREIFHKHRHPILVAMAWMAGTLVSFTVMAIGARELSTWIGTFEILFFRSLIGLVILSPMLCRYERRQALTRNFGTHILRNCAHFGGQFAWFYAIASIPLAEVFAIEFTVPIWTMMLATVILSERLTRARLIAVCLGLAGMLLILRPGTAALKPAALVMLLGAIAYGLSHTLTKRLVAVDTPLTILFLMTIIQLPLGLIPALANWVTPPLVLWPWLAVVGTSAIMGHYCLARALAHADVMVVVPLDFLRLPLIALVGFCFYGEHLEGFVFAGALLMLAGNLLNIHSERRRSPLEEMKLDKEPTDTRRSHQAWERLR